MAIDHIGEMRNMKNDLVSKASAIDIVRFECGEWKGLAKTIIKRFEQLPSVQPERKRGKWEMLQMPISPPVYKCSVCGSHALQSMTGCLMNRHYEANLTNYCPNCGAKMEKLND